MRDLSVVYITDQNYMMPTCVSIVSLKMNRKKAMDHHIYVLTAGVSEDEKERLSALSEDGFQVSILDVEAEGHKKMAETCVYKDIHVTSVALYKFEIADILSEIDKVLYLDGDVLINDDISELFDMDISDVYVAAVDEMGDGYTCDGRSKLAARIGLSGQRYFNSGVLLLNLEKMRQDSICERLIGYRRERRNYFMDQDAINAVMGPKRMSLPYRYNFRTALFDIMDLEEINERFFEVDYPDIKSCLTDQAIIHMSDKRKPWKYNFPWITELFLYFYDKSPYKDEKIDFLSPLKALNDEYERMKQIQDDVIKRKVWRFPFDKVERGSRIVLYGAGKVGHDLYDQAIESGYCHVVLWVDRDHINIGGKVVSPEEIKKCAFDHIVIALLDGAIISEVEDRLLRQNIDDKKIVTL